MNERHPWQIGAKDLEALYENPAAESGKYESAEVGPVVLENPHVEEPLFLREARERADKEGRPVADVLAADVAQALDNEYPGPKCLSPEQIERCVSGEANDEEFEHLTQCANCRMIVELGRPSPPMRAKFLADAARWSNQTKEILSGSTGATEREHTPKRIKVRSSLVGALACSVCFLAGAVATKFYANLAYDGQRIDRQGTAQRELAISPSGSDAVLADKAGNFWLFDREGGRKPIEFRASKEAQLKFPEFSADGKHVTAAGANGEIAVWALHDLEGGATSEAQIYASAQDWTAALQDKSGDRPTP